MAILPSVELLAARSKLRSHISELGISNNEFSKHCDVPQYALSKFFRGHIRSITPVEEQALIYADIGINHDITPLAHNPAIRRTLGLTWYETEEEGKRMVNTPTLERLGYVSVRLDT